MDFMKVKYEAVVCSHMSRDWNHWWAVMNVRLYWRWDIFLSLTWMLASYKGFCSVQLV